MDVAFMDMLVRFGDPFCKFHTYVAGLLVVVEMTGKEAKVFHVDPNKSKSKQKINCADRKQREDSENKKKKKKIEKYCEGDLCLPPDCKIKFSVFKFSFSNS